LHNEVAINTKEYGGAIAQNIFNKYQPFFTRNRAANGIRTIFKPAYNETPGEIAG